MLCLVYFLTWLAFGRQLCCDPMESHVAVDITGNAEPWPVEFKVKKFTREENHIDTLLLKINIHHVQCKKFKSHRNYTFFINMQKWIFEMLPRTVFSWQVINDTLDQGFGGTSWLQPIRLLRLGHQTSQESQSMTSIIWETEFAKICKTS